MNNENTWKRCEICSKLTVKKLGVFIVNFEHISHIFSSIPIVHFEQLNVFFLHNLNPLHLSCFRFLHLSCLRQPIKNIKKKRRRKKLNMQCVKSKCHIDFSNVNPLSTNPTKWSNTLKQCLSVFDHSVGLTLKGLNLNHCTPVLHLISMLLSAMYHLL